MADKRMYFSESQNLGIGWGATIEYLDDGKKRAKGARNIEFRSFDGKYGVYETSDPAEIEYLDKRCKESGDVFDHNEYSRRITPPDIREAELQRKIQEQNALIAKLEQESANRGRSNAKA